MIFKVYIPLLLFRLDLV